jgi:hypothetical protein
MTPFGNRDLLYIVGVTLLVIVIAAVAYWLS